MSSVEHTPAQALVHVADDGTRWSVTLEIPDGGAPLIWINGPAAPTLRMSYLVTTVMEAVLEGRGFVFGWSEHLFRFSPVAIAAIAKRVIDATPGSVGDYVVTWRPIDPNFPF